MKKETEEDREKRQHAEKVEYFDQYAMYSSNLRNWFIAYGVGGILFLTRAEAAFNKPGSTVDQSMKLLAIELCFAGLMAQVILAAINKVAHFYAYQQYLNEGAPLTRCQKIGCWTCERFGIDLILDGATIASFVWATTLMRRLL